jgi:hypothetical protein
MLQQHLEKLDLYLSRNMLNIVCVKCNICLVFECNMHLNMTLLKLCVYKNHMEIFVKHLLSNGGCSERRHRYVMTNFW